MPEEAALQGGPAATGTGPEADTQPPESTAPASSDGHESARGRAGLRRLRRTPRPRTADGTDSYTPGLRWRPAFADEPSLSQEAAEWAKRAAIRRAGQAIAWLRVYTPIARRHAIDLWARRPRSWAEAVAMGRAARAEGRRQWPVVRAWSIRHRVLLGGMTTVLVFASADGTLGLLQTDAEVGPGVALRVPVQYPLQVQASPETSKRYLDAINNGEHLREQAVVSAAAAATLERAKAEAAAAVAGRPQPWMTPSPDSSLPPGFVIPGVGGFALPAKGVFTSGFGARWGTFHAGIDIAAPLGSPIYAVAAGTVIDAGPAQGFGLWVRIRHDDGTISVYGHMYDFSVSVGERVPAGLQIARIGNRGDSTGPHLHFEIIINGQHVDPQPWLAQHGIIVG